MKWAKASLFLVFLPVARLKIRRITPCFDVTPEGLYDANMVACCGCGVCEAVCPVKECVTMVNETEFKDNSSQWEAWRKDQKGYEGWLAEKIKHRPERSHGFRYRGQYEEQLPEALASAGEK